MRPGIENPKFEIVGSRELRRSSSASPQGAWVESFRIWSSQFFRIPVFGYRISNLAAVLCLLGAAFSAAGCRRDMFNQPYSKPLEKSDFFSNQMASRPVVPHTVARGQLHEDDAFYAGRVGTNLVATFPTPVTQEVLLRGRERFEIYCAPCHGRTGDGNGMIPQRGFPKPPSYHTDRLRQAPVGHFYDVITRGYGVMFPYASRVDPADRWAIVAYIRVLQLSHDARPSDVPEEKRAMLEAMQSNAMK